MSTMAPPARHGLQIPIHSAHIANLVVGIRAPLGTLREIHLTGINKGRRDHRLILVLMAKHLGEEHGVVGCHGRVQTRTPSRRPQHQRLALIRILLFVFGELERLWDPGLVPAVPYVGVDRHHAVPGDAAGVVIGKVLEPRRDVGARAKLAAHGALGLHGFAAVFVDGVGFGLGCGLVWLAGLRRIWDGIEHE
ncbi:hypothetical protein N7486_007977 [Penicillium sp. IBT 16267x]|nr:hypothetical protein N7486_007977 [Penicillium sp. IBT 16267x]